MLVLQLGCERWNGKLKYNVRERFMRADLRTHGSHRRCVAEPEQGAAFDRHGYGAQPLTPRLAAFAPMPLGAAKEEAHVGTTVWMFTFFKGVLELPPPRVQ